MSELRRKVSATEIIGLKTMIVGDVGSGKTLLTARILDELVDIGYKDDITVIDLGPEKYNVGYRLQHYSMSINMVKTLTPKNLKAPRLEGKTAMDVIKIAEDNVKRIEPLFQRFISSPTPILIVNDLSIYLQAGPIETVLQLINKSDTFIANSYLGKKLSKDHGSGLSKRERKAVLILTAKMDRVIRL